MKSLYGLSAAPKLWYQHLMNALEKDGFKPSDHDRCLLYKPDMIIFLWVDDCGIGAPTMQDVDDFIVRMEEQGLSLKKEGNFTDYLGIHFDYHSNGSIEMTQRGLIQKVLRTTLMTNCHPNATPSAQLIQGILAV